MTYRYYKFPNKETVPTSWPEGVSISEVGRIGNKDMVYDNEGRTIKPQTYKSGWHVNICYQGDIDLSFISQYEIEVQTPRQVWFGQQT